MPASELAEWVAFERVAGPLTLHERVDYGLAHLAATLVAAQSGSRQSVADFLPSWAKEPTPEVPVEIVMRSFDRLTRKGGK